MALFKDYQGTQLKPEQLQKPGSDQFKSQFDLGMRSNERDFLTSYQNQFYCKASDEVKLQNQFIF